jgi:hypothetical protein
MPCVMQYCNTGVRRPFGGRTRRVGGRPCPLRLIWTRRGIVDREITVPNLLYCSNFSYYFPPMWSCGRWQSEVGAHGSVPAPVWPFRFTMGGQSMPVWPLSGGREGLSSVSGGRAAQAGGPPHRQPWCHGIETMRHQTLQSPKDLIYPSWSRHYPA